MPFRRRYLANATDHFQLLTTWRAERSFRVGKALAGGGVLLTLVATFADFLWSPNSVIYTDLVLLLGCGISYYLLRSKSRPHYFWWPLYIGYWISLIPSLWTTGGLNGPFIGVALTNLYVLGAVLDSKNRSFHYLVFALLHVPFFCVVDFFYPLYFTQNNPVAFNGLIIAVTIVAIFICIHAILMTERELSFDFSRHFRHLAMTKEVLKDKESQLREAQSIALIGNWEWNIESDQIYWSDELFNIFDIKKESFDPSFSAYLKRLDVSRGKQARETIEHSIATGSNFSFEYDIQTSQGLRSIVSFGRAIRDESGKVTKLRGTSQDITTRKQIENELRAARANLEKRVEERTTQLAQSLEREKVAKEIAENASRAKMQFLANMSHEIRTPMNSILGFSELLQSENLVIDEGKEYLGRIRTNGTQLLHLIDDILDLSKFEEGRIPLSKEAFSVRELVDDVVNSFLPILKSKGLEMKLAYNLTSEVHIHSDSQRLGQILTNLIGNSVKFSEQGEIRVTVTQERIHASQRIQLCIDVEDTGIGISPEHQKNLFQPFSQGDSSVARKFGGSGLGLALSRRIAEALGGHLELRKSHFGEGSHFAVILSVDPVESAKPVGSAKIPVLPHAEDLKNKKILLAEDSDDNAYLIQQYVKSVGGKLDVATDGQQVLKMAEEGGYDCILMDVQMPVMDGLEATTQLRKKGFDKPIIALTAHALPTEAARSIEAGCNLHLTKPIRKKELLEALKDQLHI